MTEDKATHVSSYLMSTRLECRNVLRYNLPMSEFLGQNYTISRPGLANFVRGRSEDS